MRLLNNEQPNVQIIIINCLSGLLLYISYGLPGILIPFCIVSILIIKNERPLFNLQVK